MRAKTKYKVNVRFTGSASVEIEADSAEAARIAALELELADLARPGSCDIHQFQVAAREITAVSALGGVSDDEDEESASKPRPSGWYRPL
ncbi:MAG: hypothetical protein ABIY70_13790 [Capsulimonas sp.]|uniref:hypothetical protein n=1 Tax=Capsulimonas sp. TaxID=2494211 RepID=UPI003263E867